MAIHTLCLFCCVDKSKYLHVSHLFVYLFDNVHKAAELHYWPLDSSRCLPSCIRLRTFFICSFIPYNCASSNLKAFQSLNSFGKWRKLSIHFSFESHFSKNRVSKVTLFITSFQFKCIDGQSVYTHFTFECLSEITSN